MERKLTDLDKFRPEMLEGFDPNRPLDKLPVSRREVNLRNYHVFDRGFFQQFVRRSVTGDPLDVPRTEYSGNIKTTRLVLAAWYMFRARLGPFQVPSYPFPFLFGVRSTIPVQDEEGNQVSTPILVWVWYWMPLPAFRSQERREG